MVGYRADFQNLRTAYKLKLSHLTEGGADKAAATESQKKNWQETQPHGKSKTELLIKYQHQGWMLKE
jgi:hypothetical protein